MVQVTDVLATGAYRVLISRQALVSLQVVLKHASDLCDGMEAEKNRDNDAYVEVKLMKALEHLRNEHDISATKIKELLQHDRRNED